MKNNKAIPGVYIIKNIITSKVYVGSSFNILKRFNEHNGCLKKNKHHNKHLQNSYNKHGKENFSFIILETVLSERHIIAFEQSYLDYYKKLPRWSL